MVQDMLKVKCSHLQEEKTKELIQMQTCSCKCVFGNSSGKDKVEELCTCLTSASVHQNASNRHMSDASVVW